MDLEIRYPNDRDMQQLAKHLRVQDQAELSASHGDDYFAVIRDCVAQSADAWALLIDRKVMFIAGYCDISLLSGAAAPWLLGTDLVARHPRVFLRYSGDLLAEVRRNHSSLLNFVDVRNTVAIRYLKHMGFELEDPIPYGRKKMMFYPFRMEV